MIRALTFDLFGTVFDWRGTIVREGRKLNPNADWNSIAIEWARGYSRVAKAGGPRIPLSKTLKEVGMSLNLPVPHEEKDGFVNIWSRLDPYPDVFDSLNKLEKAYTLAALSNADDEMAWSLAERPQLPFHYVCSSETVGEYKPHPKVYCFASRYLAVEPYEILMVAAHLFDLEGAKNMGYQTAFVSRPGEDGDPNVPYVDMIVSDFNELADKLQDRP